MFDYFNNDAYWVLPNESDRFVITSVPYVSDDLELPIGVVVDQDREVTFKIDGVEDFTGSVYLFDKEKSTIKDLTEGSHIVTLASGNYTNRFSLVFDEEESLSTDYIDKQTKSVIYVLENKIEIILASGNIDHVGIYSLTGKLLISHQETETTNHSTINTENLVSQFYVIKIVSNEDSFSKNIFIE